MKREWTDLEFADWTLLASEAALLANKTGPTRLGFAVLLKFFQYAARFPLSMQEVPATAVAYIARQVSVPAEELEAPAFDFHYERVRVAIHHGSRSDAAHGRGARSYRPIAQGRVGKRRRLDIVVHLRKHKA